jgi:hypothetical protein
MDSLAGRKLADIIPSLNVGIDDGLSPCRRLFVTQPGLEPILRRQAKAAGAEVLEGHEIVALTQDADAVTATARDVETGTTRVLRATAPTARSASCSASLSMGAASSPTA